MRYISTRGHPTHASFESAILSGYAPDGGLWVPEVLPRITPAMLRAWSGDDGPTFPCVAAHVLALFSGEEIPFSSLLSITRAAFATFDHPDVIPLVPVTASGSFQLLETWHGETMAFKDIGLQVLARLIDYFLSRRSAKANIIMETSGDTGPSALSAAQGLDSIEMFCLYPKGRVSRVQELQIITMPPLSCNLHVYRTEGTTDDQAATIKALFGDASFASKYHCCSMNSINVGRIAVQSSYYVYTYLKILKSRKHDRNSITARLPNSYPMTIDFVIPTGAFGNACAGFWAKQMGLPIRKICVATNDNDIVHRAISAGDFTPGRSIATVSPAMDIQLPYNFERFLHSLLGGDAAACERLVPILRRDPSGKCDLPKNVVEMIAAAGVSSMAVSDADTLNTMTRHWRERHYCLGPHSAIGVFAAEQYRRDLPSGDNSIVVAVLTAHPSKFEAATRSAIGQDPPDVPERVRKLDTMPTSYDTRMGPPRYRHKAGADSGGEAISEWLEVLKADIVRASEGDFASKL